MANALAHQSSPYLRQHGDNPVDWRPWEDAAFAEARRREVPVLISIGYSTCHWCHVMAHESFEDPGTAAVMNELFVCIKVDREEHPEVDEIYMDAVQALTGHGGWPLNAFTDHAGRPFYAMTYAPRARWVELLRELARLWRDDRPRITRVAAEVLGHLAHDAPTPGILDEAVMETFASQLARSWDAAHPGFAFTAQRAPKFPPSQLLPLLIASPHAEWRTMAETTLQAMQDAGIHDRVGGGFHRYSVDREWRLPHFEKMLYDNAQLMGTYAWAARVFQRPDFHHTAVNTGDYLLRDLALGNGSFAAAEDADDPAGEGSFYAWSPDALRAVLGDELGARVAEAWDIHPGEREIGPHGHADPVLSHIPHPRARAATAERATWEPLYPRLRAARDQRPRPSRDDKAVTDLNALALEGFAGLARYSDGSERERFANAAIRLAGWLAARHTSNGLQRLPHRPAYITDYGHLVSALTAAFEVLGDPTLIDRAVAVADEAILRLRADDGGFFTTPAGRGDLVRRSRESADNAYPAGQNALCVGLIRLWNVTGLERWRIIAEGIFAAAAGFAKQAPTAVCTLIAAWQAYRQGQRSAVVVGDAADPRTQDLLWACRGWAGGRLAVVPEATCRTRDWACLEGRRELSEPQALICVGSHCLAPAFSADAVVERLDTLKQASS